MSRNNILKYVGSKQHTIKQILELIKNIKFDKLVELYCGSAIISIELNKIFQPYHQYFFYPFKEIFAIDIDDNIINFYNYLKNNSEVVLKKYSEYHYQLVKDRKFYYEIRDKFNKQHDIIDWFFLNRTCICSMMRYNNSGEFNSSIHPNRNGIKPKKLKKIFDKNLKSIQNINFINEDAEDFINKVKVESYQTLFILDPPYFGTTNNMMYYQQNNEEKLLRILNRINDLKQYFILFYGSNLFDRTDILNSIIKNRFNTESITNGFFRKVNTDEKRKINDLLYTNF